MIKRISGNPTVVGFVLLFSIALFWYFVWHAGWSDRGKAIGFLATLVVGVWTAEGEGAYRLPP